MGVKFRGFYKGDKRCEIIHIDSDSLLKTVAPKDNNGDGSSFSPTDTVASALGSCMLTICGIKAERENHDLSGAGFEVEKIMTSNPRRIGQLNLNIILPKSLPLEVRDSYETALRNCPVHHSLNPNIQLNLVISYA